MKLVRAVRNVTAKDAADAGRVAGSALALTALLVFLASAAFLVLLLPLVVLAALNPTVTFGVSPPTQYPTTYFGVQTLWTGLVGIGGLVAARSIDLPPMTTEETSLPADHPPTPDNERLAGLVETVAVDD